MKKIEMLLNASEIKFKRVVGIKKETFLKMLEVSKKHIRNKKI